MKRFAQTLLACTALASATLAADLKFSVVPNYFDAQPGQQALGPCHGGTVIDKAGNIYVTTDTERGIAIFSSKGKYLRSVGPTRIHALELRSEQGVEYIYAARPLTVAPDGSIFVADGYGSNYVLKFDKNRKFVKAFGGPGEAEGKFKTCHGIGMDTRSGKPLLFVCNRNNNRVEHWDLDGNFIKVIQKDLRMPAAVHIRGDYALIPELQGRATLLNKNGTIAAQVGDNPNEKQRANFGLAKDQWQDGICNSPHGGSIDSDGNLIISEWSAFGHLHKFVRAK
ncbi:MAG: hypothetical protein NTV12_12605 [Verrucomicrobia bacterium]|nr:hypothetical protein [Verrucomicrobiota bacterium]